MRIYFGEYTRMSTIFKLKNHPIHNLSFHSLSLGINSSFSTKRLVILAHEKSIILLSLLLLLSCYSCQKNDIQEAHISLQNYKIQDGFDLKVIASEPILEAPVAMDFDEEGRIWVVEMKGYMPNLDGIGEEEPSGRIIILEDKDGDGVTDHYTVFLDKLVLPRALALVYGGVLYAEPPNLWFVKRNGDQAGQKQLVDDQYAIGGNVEHQANGLIRHLDNWIYSARSTARYKKVDKKWLKEVEPLRFRGQWGITFDKFGRLFYNDNSNPIYADLTNPGLLTQNPNHTPSTGVYEMLTADRRLWPLHPTAVNRGYIEGNLDDNGILKNVTSTCGPLIYNGGIFPNQFDGNAFVCAPEGNLIKRYIISGSENHLKAELAYIEKEFIASTDEGFRPVNLYNGPDGAIYIVDFHRGIIQHKIYMTAYLKDIYEAKQLDTIVHFGRILKVYPKNGDEQESVNFSTKTSKELATLLGHSNGFVRNKAQQYLIERKANDTSLEIEKIALNAENPLGQIHALWTLEGLKLISVELIEKVYSNSTPRVKNLCFRFLENFYKKGYSPDIETLLNIGLKENHPIINLQLAISLGKYASIDSIFSFPKLQSLIDNNDNDTLLYNAILSGLSNQEEVFLNFLKSNGTSLDKLIFNYLNNSLRIKNKPKTQKNPNSGTKDSKTHGLALYRKHCQNCHGKDGLGIPNLAPPLYKSDWLEGDTKKLILITLHGLEGPIHVNGELLRFNNVMPGLRDNPDLSDEDIANLLSFVRNAFGTEPIDINKEAVKSMRIKAPKNNKLFTEETLRAIRKD